MPGLPTPSDPEGRPPRSAVRASRPLRRRVGGGGGDGGERSTTALDSGTPARPAGHLCAVIDDGGGPRMVFVDARDLARVGGLGSPLGRALVGARAGDRIRVRDPQRPLMVRLVELYPL